MTTRGLPVPHAARKDAHVDDVKEVLHVARVVGDLRQRLSACVREIFAEARSHTLLCVLDGVVDIHCNGISRNVVKATGLSHPIVVAGERANA